MTVREMIEMLNEMPPDMPITIGTPWGDFVAIDHISIAPADEGEVAYIEAT